METLVSILVGLAVVAGVIGVVGAAAIIFGIVWGIRRALYAIKGEEYKPLIGGRVSSYDYDHQDIDNGATSESIERVFRRYLRVETVGKYARDGLAAIENDRRKVANFYGVLESKFPQSSLSWGKFSVAAEATHDTILRNCAALANHIQLFDFVEYRRVERAHRVSRYRQDAQPTDMQIEKYNLMHATLAQMDGIIESNEKLLLELDKLSAELGTLDNVDTSENSERIVEEIRTLIDETKYYK